MWWIIGVLIGIASNLYDERKQTDSRSPGGKQMHTPKDDTFKRKQVPARPTALPYLLAAFCLLPLTIFAEDWTTSDGQTYKNVKVLSHDAGNVVILDDDGGATVELAKLPRDVQKRFGYDPAKAAAAVAAAKAQDAKDQAALAAEERATDAQKEKALQVQAIQDQQQEQQRAQVANAVFIHGKVLQITDGGVIVDCDSDKYESGVPGGPLKLIGEGIAAQRIFGVTIFLTNAPNQGTLVDGDTVEIVAYPTGPHSYTNVMGANTTIASYTATLPGQN